MWPHLPTDGRASFSLSILGDLAACPRLPFGSLASSVRSRQPPLPRLDAEDPTSDRSRTRNSNDSSKRAWAIGVASILVMGGLLILPSAAQADQLGGDGGPSASRLYSGLDIDDIVAQRKVAMAPALVDRD